MVPDAIIRFLLESVNKKYHQFEKLLKKGEGLNKGELIIQGQKTL